MKVERFEAPDISQYQGNVNFKTVRNAGYPKVFLRAGYGKNNIDQRYISNAQACYNLEIPVGIYWFSYALDAAMAAQEARYAIAQAAKFWDKCPVAFDLEYDTRRYAATKGVNIDKKLATDMAIEFLKVVKECGYTPVVYMNRDYKKNYLDLDRIRAEVGKEVRLWYALYGMISEEELKPVDIWQMTSKGSIPGISGNVDINKVYSDIFNDFAAMPTENKPVPCNLYIQSFQRAANMDKYRDSQGLMLAEDGLDGPKTQSVRRKINLRARWTLTGYKVDSTGEVVRWLQTRLSDIGYGLAVDGKYGKDTRAAVVDFQKKNGLAVDGIAGYNTIQILFYV